MWKDALKGNVQMQVTASMFIIIIIIIIIITIITIIIIIVVVIWRLVIALIDMTWLGQIN